MVVVIKKQKTSFNLSEPLMEEFRRVAGPYGEKRQWLVVSAAILMMLDSPAEVREAFMAAAATADIGMGSYADLLERAKAGKLRSEIEADVKAGSRSPTRGRSTVAKGQAQDQRG